MVRQPEFANRLVAAHGRRSAEQHPARRTASGEWPSLARSLVESVRARVSGPPATEPRWPEPLLLGRDAGLLRAQWGRLYFMRWEGPATLRRIETIRGDLLRVATEFDSLVVVSILERGTSPPGEQGRQMIARTEEQVGDRFRALAYLADSQAFFVSMALGVLLNIRQRRRASTHPEKVFGEARAAGLWLRNFLPGPVSPVEVYGAIRAVQRMGRS